MVEKVLLCGNGGSAADCEHIVAELMKSYHFSRKMPKDLETKLTEIHLGHAEYIYKNLEVGLKAISLVSQIGLNTAFANDRRPDLCFAQQVLTYGDENDVLWVLTTSGNSKNIIYASEVAKAKNMKVIALLGKNGGKVKKLCDAPMIVNLADTAEIQELHLPIYHTICNALEYEFFCI